MEVLICKQGCDKRWFHIALGVLMIFLVAGCNGTGSKLPPPTVRPVNAGPSPVPQVTPTVAPAEKPITQLTVPRGWLPPFEIEKKWRWEGIVIHHSMSKWGTAADIDKWHKQRGFDGMGYHFVIDNGRGGADGNVEVGYRWHKQMTGAHCRIKGSGNNYWNERTIGICLVGDFDKRRPSPAQYDSLAQLVHTLQKRYNIPLREIRGHGQVPGAKTACPGRLFSWWQVRQQLSQLSY